MYTFKAKLEYFPLALLASIVGHIGLVYLLFYKLGYMYDLPKPVIYSISIESSADKGGISQTPEKVKETPPAPPKKAAAPPEEEEKQDEDIINIKESPVKESTPKPKPTAKPKPSPSPKPKPKSTPKPKPVKKSTPKPKLPKKEVKYEDAMQKYLGESTNAGGKGFGSKGTGSKKNAMGGGEVKPPAWFRYKRALEYHVKSGWNWHDTSRKLMASVAFSISRTGKVSNVYLVASSGNNKYDDSVKRAVQKASPVPIPPPEFYEDFREVIMDFEPDSF